MATIFQNESAWSTAEATNANVDTGVNWVEGQDAASVNNSARGMMTARRKAALDQGGALTVAGTANALTVTTNQVLSAAHLMAGQRLLVRADVANTTTGVTLAVDGLTARSIKRADGSALAIGSIQAGMALDLIYNSGSSEWRCVNIEPRRTQPSFSAHNSAVNITPGTTAPFTITFGAVIYDVGNYFSAGAWTPPAGTIMLSAALYSASALPPTDSLTLYLYKNGVAFKAVQIPGNTTVNVSAALTILDQAGGSDVYTLRSASTYAAYIIGGASYQSYFMGSML